MSRTRTLAKRSMHACSHGRSIKISTNEMVITKPALTLFMAVLASRRAGLYKHGNQLKNSGELGFVRARWQRRGAGRPLTVDFEALSYISGLVEAF